MELDPLSREAALKRVQDAGESAGKFGTPVDRNPFKGKPSMQSEFACWEAGRQIGAAQRKAGKA